MEVDRTSLVPSHEGDNVLPLCPFFTRLLRHARRQPSRPAIRDDRLGLEKNYLQLLTDVLAFRNSLRPSLAREARDALDQRKEVYIALIAPGGYEYAVGFVAIAALGAAVVPIAVSLPVQEASYFFLKASCAAVVVSSDARPLGESLTSHLSRTHRLDIPCLAVFPNLNQQRQQRHFPPRASDITISSNGYLDDNAAAVVIFTSGTTGPPKGAVMRRGFLHDNSDAIIQHFRITETDVILHVLPVHHATGIGITFLPFIHAGACVEFRSGGVDVAWLWERWKRGGLDFFSGVPTIYMRMMRHFEQNLAGLPPHERREYVGAARALRGLLSGTSALPAPVAQFWTGILGGKRRIISRYGATEIGPVFTEGLGGEERGQKEDSIPEGSVGPLFPGVTAKLAGGGNEGELLVKSPYMFARYLSDPDATGSAHDADGFFKTGDIVRQEGDNYFILGRASIDILKSGGYKISALDIEREILGLPYVSEVMVVGVADEEFGQRVAAVLCLRDDQGMYDPDPDVGSGPDSASVGSDINGPAGSLSQGSRKKFTITDLRRDLRDRVAGYKLPTLLRVVNGELPKSATGKVVKKVLGPRYFPAEYESDGTVQVWRREAKL